MRSPQKISFREMRDQGVRGILIYCADYHCSHSLAITQIDGQTKSARAVLRFNLAALLSHPSIYLAIFGSA
jgi:hypothetical protein